MHVHKALGPGLLEAAYEKCLAIELARRGIPFRRQVPVPIRYAGELVEDAFRLDILVGHRVILELKACASIEDIHKAQLLTYMKLMKVEVGLLLNFNVPKLTDGITRMALSRR